MTDKTHPTRELEDAKLSVLALHLRCKELREALKIVLSHASPEEGQAWEIMFQISEDLYGKWEDLCDD